MLDFNDVPSNPIRKVHSDSTDTVREKDDIRQALNERLSALVLDIWPSGKGRQNKYLVGDVMGGPGDSLELLLFGSKSYRNMQTDILDFPFKESAELFDVVGDGMVACLN